MTSEYFDELKGDDITRICFQFSDRVKEDPLFLKSALNVTLINPEIREILRRYNRYSDLSKFYEHWKKTNGNTQQCIYCGGACSPIDRSKWFCPKCNTKWTPERMESV